MADQYVTIDKIKWWVWTNQTGGRGVQPICPIHNIRMYPALGQSTLYVENAMYLQCAECEKWYPIPRMWNREQQYILDKVESKQLKDIKFINLDDEALPISEDKISSKDNKYFVTSLLTKSKTGLRLVVYAGEKGKKDKTQIFVEPDIKRLAFDQKDLHPIDVFTKLEATFSDGSKAEMEK
jgi:hypothetical protein